MRKGKILSIILSSFTHDELIDNSNKEQTWTWGEEEKPALLLKTKGSGLMVSDFIEEHNGHLHL